MPAHRNIFQRVLTWRLQHKSSQNFFFLCSVLVGLIAGFLALGLKSVVYYLREFFLSDSLADSRFLLLLLPGIGMLITILFKKFVLKDNILHNVSSILHAISKRKSLMRRHKIFSSVLGAVFTAGFGGSVGLESPIISSGGALGSNLGRYLKMNYKEITVLLACGSAAGISAIFNTPIAGIIFAIEVLMIDLTRFSLIPLLLSSMTGTLVTFLFYGEGILFQYSIKEGFEAGDIPYYIVFSIFAALISLYFTRTYLWVEGLFQKIKSSYMRWFIAAAVFGVILYLFPQLYGEGYLNVTHLLNHDMHAFIGDMLFHEQILSSSILFIAFVLVLVMLKVVATSITISAGGIGGIFAPSAVTGAFAGYVFALSVNLIAGEQIISPGNFALVGMAACLSGVLHAPLTGLFLIAEITQGYHLIVPLMIAVTLVFIIVKALESNSIFTMQLAKRGELITHHKDKAVLTFLKLEKVIERDLVKVPVDANLGELTQYIAQSKRNIFPVVNDNGDFEGIIHVEDIREIMFQKELYDSVFVRNVMRIPDEIIQAEDSMQTVMDKFHRSNAWNLPVVNQNKFIGVISKSSLFSAYRKQLINITDE
jgi:CIC family chloride channel protein